MNNISKQMLWNRSDCSTVSIMCMGLTFGVCQHEVEVLQARCFPLINIYCSFVLEAICMLPSEKISWYVKVASLYNLKSKESGFQLVLLGVFHTWKITLLAVHFV